MTKTKTATPKAKSTYVRPSRSKAGVAARAAEKAEAAGIPAPHATLGEAKLQSAKAEIAQRDEAIEHIRTHGLERPMPAFLITPTIPGHLCVEAGYPDPDTDPVGWIDAVRNKAAWMVQEHGIDLSQANRLIQVAIARADYEPPRALSVFEMEILEELAA